MTTILDAMKAVSAAQSAAQTGTVGAGDVGGGGTVGGAQLPAATPAPTMAPAAAPTVAPALQANLGAIGTPAAPTNNTPMAVPAGTPLSNPTTGTTPALDNNQVAQLGQPAAWNVTGNQTVEQRLASILQANSPIIQAARTRALEGMNGRGLINSSMALGASELAAQTAALPIAQADAATEAKAASYNADQQNQFGIKNVDALNQRMLAGLNTDTQKVVQQMQLDNSKLLQTNNQASTAFNQALVSMTNINMNDKMDANAKTQAIAQIQRDLQSQLKVLSATTGLNLSSQLNFSGYDGFDASGNYVGFSGAGGAPVAAPAPAADVGSGNYYGV